MTVSKKHKDQKVLSAFFEMTTTVYINLTQRDKSEILCFIKCKIHCKILYIHLAPF